MRPTAAVTGTVCAALALAACTADGPRRQSTRDTATVSLVDYACESGARIHASYLADAVAVLRYRSQTHEMTRIRAASGARYADDALEWWSKGTHEATLSVRFADGNSGDILEHCREVSPGG